MKELISVIVPVYNVEAYLEKCIQSIGNQTYCNIEIILVNDGSLDRSLAICKEFARMDPRIKIIDKKNGGLSDARNAGLEVANGEYIVFVDSDDYINYEMLEMLYERISRDQSELVICNIEVVAEKGTKAKEAEINVVNEVWDSNRFWNELYGKNHMLCVVAWNKMYRRELFDQIRFEVGKQHEDEFVIHEIISGCRRISCIQDKLYYYVQRENSITNQKYSVKRLDYVEALIKRSLYFRQNGRQDFAEISLTRCIGAMLIAKDELNFRCRENKLRYRELKHSLKQTYFILAKGEASIRFRINIVTFLLGHRFYRITHHVLALYRSYV